MKNILITGISGMVGSHLSDLLLSSDIDCCIYGCARWRSPLTNLDVSFELARKETEKF